MRLEVMAHFFFGFVSLTFDVLTLKWHHDSWGNHIWICTKYRLLWCLSWGLFELWGQKPQTSIHMT